MTTPEIIEIKNNITFSVPYEPDEIDELYKRGFDSAKIAAAILSREKIVDFVDDYGVRRRSLARADLTKVCASLEDERRPALGQLALLPSPGGLDSLKTAPLAA